MKKITVESLRYGDFFTMGGGRGMCQYTGNLWYIDEFNQKRRFEEGQKSKIVYLY